MLVFSIIYDEHTDISEDEKGLEVDEQLFSRIGNGDMGAFDELYQITERTMYAFCLSLTKDHQISLDLMQDTYVKILSASHLYSPMGKPLAWMFTIAKNIFYSDIRKKSKVVNFEPEVYQNDSRFSYITEIEDRIVLEAVLKRLTEEEREIVLLYAVSGMKHREIADSIGLNLSTTLSKYHRALKKLRTFLDGKGVRA